MKIVRIGDIQNISHSKENNEKNPRSLDYKYADEILIKLKDQGIPSSLKEEMRTIQRDISIAQAKVEALSNVSRILKNYSSYTEELKNELENIYKNSKFEDIFLLEDIKKEIFSGDIETIYKALDRELNNLSDTIEKSRKNVNAVMVKFQNISTFIDNISSEQIENTAKLIISSFKNTQGILNISPNSIMKFLSN
ncbi:MAG: hypothetical protein N2712_05510 [Brevinematales bacterium]|nr:hypothetical protein [Brevinematales bacterium]